MEYNFEIIPNEQTPKVEQSIFNIDDIEKNRELYEAFLEFAKSQKTAVGLAANQCSLNGKRFMHRLFAMKLTDINEWILVINPTNIKFLGQKEKKLEGCLTWKEKNIVADRYPVVHADYLIQNKTQIRNYSYTGFNAQIFQHEYNHIEGIPEEIVEPSYQLPPQTKIKIGRNEKCLCGSGLKYKNCCLKYENLL